MPEQSAPPVIFDPVRRRAARARMRRLQQRPDAARFVIEDMVEDIRERLAFIRAAPRRALVLGDHTGALADALVAGGADVVRADPVPRGDEIGIAEDKPYPEGGFDLIASLALLDTVNDLPGALIHMRAALAPDGLAIAAFAGAGSLPALRAAMLAADGERPSPRLHPMVDVRAGAQLIQRAGWADPVVDGHALQVRYGTLDRLVEDLREQALGNVLAAHGPALGRSALAQARAAFMAQADADGRVSETFQIITLSGRRPRDRGF